MIWAFPGFNATAGTVAAPLSSDTTLLAQGGHLLYCPSTNMKSVWVGTDNVAVGGPGMEILPGSYFPINEIRASKIFVISQSNGMVVCVLGYTS